MPKSKEDKLADINESLENIAETLNDICNEISELHSDLQMLGTTILIDMLIKDQPELKKIYDRRKACVEHLFGYIKKVIGFGQFSIRGRLAAQAEASVVSTCFNLTRMITLLGGVQGLISKLQTA